MQIDNWRIPEHSVGKVKGHFNVGILELKQRICIEIVQIYKYIFFIGTCSEGTKILHKEGHRATQIRITVHKYF